MIPNLQFVVEQTAAEYPQEFADAHTGNSHTEDFIRRVAARCHAIDSRFGLNGKRGNPNDLSDDALNFVGEGGGTTPQGMPCSVIDVIAGAPVPGSGLPNTGRPAWQVFSTPPDANGAWVLPDAEEGGGEIPGPEPPHVCPPVPPTFPYPDEQTAGRAYQARVKAAYAEAGRQYPDPNDPDGFFWSQRYGHSSALMPEPEAAKKHIAELRKALGLP